MKKLISVVAILAFSQYMVFAGSCLPKGIIFSTQEQIDDFRINNPGCTEIEGNVTITGNRITNLNGLHVLNSIGGNLRLFYNPALTSLTGLESLTSIGGNLRIEYNYALTSIHALENLISIGGNLLVESNYALTALTGLENLTSVEGRINIGFNHSLNDLNGLNNITYIGDGLQIYGNHNMTALSGLEDLAYIHGNLFIALNSALTDLSGMDKLISIGGNVDISENNLLADLTGFGNLTSVAGDLFIYINNALTSLDGLENLETVGRTLTISYNPSLADIAALDNLSFVGGNIVINSNQILSVCNDSWLCSLITNAVGKIKITNNAPRCGSIIDAAYSCGGLPCLPNGDYYFETQININRFAVAFPDCTDTEGNIFINGAGIYDLNGLHVLTSVDGLLNISHNPQLTDLTGLENIISIGSGLFINNNCNLSSLNALENLTSIGGYLSINWNQSLSSLTGLENIAPGSISALNIKYNHNLSSCAVGSICDFLAAPAGMVQIMNNAPGCNNSGEIMNECNSIVPGDADCDGKVDILDVVTIENYIFDLNPYPFCFENADIDSNGLINIADVVGTVSIILIGKIY